MEIKKLTVVGAGLMGKQIALSSAIHGMDVTLTDSVAKALEAAGKWADEYLDGRVAKGKMDAEKVKAVKANFHLVGDLKEAVKDADLVIEAIIENLDIKKKFFAELDGYVSKDAILATNSSTFVPSEFTKIVSNPGRFINIHYFNPALQMQLVELIVAPETTQETFDAAEKFAKATGKVPIKVTKEIDGYIVNNILAAVNGMAWKLLEEGYASAQDIDLGAEKGLGYPMGPFKLADLIGLDTIYNIRQAKYEKSGNEADKPTPLLTEKFKAGHFGRKTGKGFYDYSK